MDVPPTLGVLPEPSLLWEPGHVPDRLSDALHRSPLIEANREYALFSLETVGRFLVKANEPTIVERAPGATDKDLECLLRGPVAALRCCLNGQFALRGAAAEVQGRALVVYGTACGASSLVACLALHGHHVLADGVVCVGGSPLCASSVPGVLTPAVTLWPDSVEALGLDPAEGAIVRPSLASRSFTLPFVPTGSAVPLGVLSSLETDDRMANVEALVIPEPLEGARRIRKILKAQWHHRLMQDLGMAKQQFEWAISLATEASMARLRRAQGPILQTLAALADRAEETMA